ncbi:MAG TPA: hypothetical protein VJ865_01100 [Gemmatimonadaceae bacterium]|nr:hypothetical protein [Gemmatimonadaceae bacterium]
MTAPEPQRSIPRSIGALVAGLVVGIVLSLGTDAILRVTRIFPPFGQAMSNGMFALAITYRVIYSGLASYVAARLAPDRPMWHAMVLGVLNLVVSLIGALVTWNKGLEFGPHWYPLSLVVLALPAAWLGGRLYTSRQSPWSATREYFAR